MLRKLRARLGEEQGVAIITAIMISMIVLTLGVTSVTLAMHNTEQSAYDRRRVQSVGAAEAGLNYYFSHLQSVTSSNYVCSFTKNMTGTPVSSFTATVTFYNSSGSTIACPPTSTPAQAKIRSVGTTSGEASPTRIMEALVQLTAGSGSPLSDNAVYSHADPAFNSNVDILGDGGENADVYTNGNVLLNRNATVHGSIHAQGWIKLSSLGQVNGDAWAGNYVEVNSNSNVLGNATSADSYVYLNSNSHVYGDAKAATTITETSGSLVHGLKIPNTPSSAPPSEPFPTFTYNASDWTSQGYTISTYTSCSSAESFIRGISDTIKRLVRINSTCTLSVPPRTAINVRGDLAIVTNGSISLDSTAGFSNVGDPHKLYLFAGHGQTNLGNCSYNIEFHSGAYIGAGLTTLLHTPCKIIFNSQGFAVEGQALGGKIEFNANASLGFAGMDVPGMAGGILDEDILYIREVAV